MCKFIKRHCLFSFELFFFQLSHHCRNFEPQGRKQSLDDINLDQFLKVVNYEDTVKELDVYYGIGNVLLITNV